MIETKVFMVSSHTKVLIVVVLTMVIWRHPKVTIKMFFKGNKSKTCGTNITAVLSGVPCLEGAF